MQNKKKWVKDQQPIRYNNQKQVIDLMRSGSQSCSDIAKATGLSNTAAENIVDEMVEMGVLVKGPITDYGKLGRRPIKYKLNGELGVVVSVDLTDRDLLICISNMNRQILFRSEVKNIIMITEQILNDIVEIIKEGLQKPGISDKPLLCICFAIPGYFNKDTGEFLLANRIENCREVNIKSLFSEIFGCDILLQKDIISGVIGEMQFGVLSTLQAKNALFMHFDINIASAFIFDGKMYEGDHGFAGETGFFMPNMSDPAKGLGIYVSLTAIFINIIEKIKKEKLSHPLAGKEVLEFDEVKLLFLSGDETVCSVVKLTAKKLALHFLNINYLLDITHVVLDGRIVELGEKFLEYVNTYLKKYNQGMSEVKVQYSDLMNRAITLGSISSAVDSQIDKILRARN